MKVDAKLMPVEPPREILIAGRDALMDTDDEIDLSTDQIRECYRAIRKALPSAGAGEPVGWKRVPLDPTPEMIDRGVAFALNVTISRDYRWTEYVSDLYRRMLSASPAPASLPSEEETDRQVEK